MRDLSRLLENMAVRDRMTASMREWFRSRGYIEVTTPVRIAAPAPEPHIDCPRCGGKWLRASPELQMKRLVAAGAARIFQIGPCFREGEAGRLHAEEFTMLEWYRRGATAMEILAETRELLVCAGDGATGATLLRHRGVECDLSSDWRVIPLRDAYLELAGWDPVAAFDQDRFDEDMALKVEPGLPREVPCVLYGYPRQAASLAKLSPGEPAVAERWELYLCGVEVANAFGELRDGAEQRSRFEEARRERAAIGEDDYPLDEGFLRSLERGDFPECGGIAVGVDRLAMLVCGADSIAEVAMLDGGRGCDS